MITIPKRNVMVIFGEPNRFYVESDQSNTDPYLVDLAENGGNGWCNCMHFQTNQKKVKEAIGTGEFLRCKHLQAAFNFKALVAVQRDMEQTEGKR